jgi:hypothetical protein
VSVPASATKATVTGLAGGTSYTFQVQAVNEYGAGSPATTAAVTPTGSSSTFASVVRSDGPSAFYRLSDSATSVMADSSPNGQSGSYVAGNVTLGAAGPVSGDAATSAEDSGSALGQANLAVLPDDGAARTVQAWVNTSDAGFQYLAGWGTANTAEGFAVALDGPNQVYVQGVDDDLYFSTPGSVADGQWHLITVAATASAASVYVDGSLVGTQRFATSLNTQPAPGGLVIGGTPWDSSQGVDGDLADVAVFPAVLSASQVEAEFAASGYARPLAPGSPAATAGSNSASVTWKAVAPATPPVTAYLVTASSGGKSANAVSVPASATKATVTGLAGGTSYTFQVQAVNEYGAGAAATTAAVTPTGSSSTFASVILADGPSAFYRLADSATSAMADSSAHGRTGSYVPGSVTLGAASPVSGDAATSAADAGSALGQASLAVLPEYDQARTVQAWVNTTNAGFQYLAGWGNVNVADQGFAVALDGPEAVYVQGVDDDLYFSTPGSVADGNWHLITVTSTGAAATVYVDGQAIGTQAFATPLDTLSAPQGLVIGGAPWDTTQGVDGDLADVAVFPVALSASQVSAQYSASAAFRTRHRTVTVPQPIPIPPIPIPLTRALMLAVARGGRS